MRPEITFYNTTYSVRLFSFPKQINIPMRTTLSRKNMKLVRSPAPHSCTRFNQRSTQSRYYRRELLALYSNFRFNSRLFSKTGSSLGCWPSAACTSGARGGKFSQNWSLLPFNVLRSQKRSLNVLNTLQIFLQIELVNNIIASTSGLLDKVCFNEM